MHGIDLILTLTLSLGAAVVLGYITQRLRLSPIVGYLIAGVVVGPYTPGFVANGGIAEQLAEIGVVLLMFGIGLEFHIEQLLAVRRVAIPGAVVQSAAATGLGAVAVHLIGWSWTAGLVFGIALSVASTVVLVRVLADNRALHTPTGHIAVGWLVVEDLFTVLILVLLPALFGSNGAAESLARALAITFLKIAVLVGLTMTVGNRLIPWLLERVANTRSRELFSVAVLALALTIAVAASTFFNVSMALGAFLAGMIVGRSDYGVRAAADAVPVRDAFAVLFFVSVGMLVDPRNLAGSPALLLTGLAIVLLVKPITAFAIVRLLGYPRGAALGVAVALAQIGEFSFILMRLGVDLGVMPRDTIQVVVTIAIISIVANPVLYRLLVGSRPVGGVHVEEHEPAGGIVPVDGAMPADHVVVVGYGPVGKTVTQLLRTNGIDVGVVDLNLETVRRLNEEGDVKAVYGDATRRETLDAAGVETARGLVLSAGQIQDPVEIIRLARERNPKIRVLARVPHMRDVARLRAAGADSVFSGEAEVALAFTENILRRLGATGDQIDRERERARQQLGVDPVEGTVGRDALNRGRV